nr:MAPEG family protein [Oceanococcus sp. HetDA_MAG_MS8]
MPEASLSSLWSAYQPVLMVLAGMGALSIVQLLVADVAGILSRHRPGFPVTPDAGSFFFRAVRAHANTNESLTAFVILALVAVFAAAPTSFTNGFCVAYGLGRIGHMLCYYLGWSLARSASFAVSAVALVGLAGTVLWTLAQA